VWWSHFCRLKADINKFELTPEEELVGFDRVRMYFNAYHAQTDWHCKQAIEAISYAATMPFALPALEYRHNQLEFVQELSKPAVEDDDGELLWPGFAFVDRYRGEITAAVRPTAVEQRHLLADAIEKRLIRHASPSRLRAPSQHVGPLSQWPSHIQE
jgi:hypothetical protein